MIQTSLHLKLYSKTIAKEVYLLMCFLCLLVLNIMLLGHPCSLQFISAASMVDTKFVHLEKYVGYVMNILVYYCRVTNKSSATCEVCIKPKRTSNC